MKKSAISTATLMVLEASGEYRPATPKEILAAAKSAVGYIYGRGSEFSSPDAAREYLSAKLAGRENECFAVLFLDNRNRLIEYREMFYGTIDASAVYPREVLKAALELNAAAVLFAHNHPSGDTEPSMADQRITARLKDALSLVEIRVLDHFIVGREVLSFLERGLL